MTRAFLRLAPTTTAAVLLASPAFAQGAKIDGADTAWMISATGLVLMMTIPGLALFYAGMVPDLPFGEEPRDQPRDDARRKHEEEDAPERRSRCPHGRQCASVPSRP